MKSSTLKCPVRMHPCRNVWWHGCRLLPCLHWCHPLLRPLSLSTMPWTHCNLVTAVLSARIIWIIPELQYRRHVSIRKKPPTILGGGSIYSFPRLHMAFPFLGGTQNYTV